MAAVSWKPIPGYESHYWVSDDGQVRGVDGRLRRQNRSAAGYWRVHLSRDGMQKTHNVHRLVAAAFLGPCPPDMVVCHGSGGSGDNRLANLRYASQRENCSVDKLRDGTHHRGERQGSAKLTVPMVLAIRALAAAGFRQDDIAWALEISRANVANIVTRRRWAWL